MCTTLEHVALKYTTLKYPILSTGGPIVENWQNDRLQIMKKIYKKKLIADPAPIDSDPSNIYVPTDEAKEIYSAYKAETEKRQLSSSENFDKSILTYSTGGLALSLTFLKDFIPIQKASCSLLLYGSWGLFSLATTLTVISFLVSYEGQTKSLDYSHKYYMEGDENYFNKTHCFNIIVKWFNWVSGGAFVSALIFTSIFVAINLDKANTMSDKKSTQNINEGLGTPSMTSVQKGVTTPTMQKIPVNNSGQNTTPPPNTQPSGNSNTNNSSK